MKCDKRYAHKHLLARHSRSHAEDKEALEETLVFDQPVVDNQPVGDINISNQDINEWSALVFDHPVVYNQPVEDINISNQDINEWSELSLMTGFDYNLFASETGRTLECPVDSACKQLFKRQWDVVRHVQSIHGRT